MPQMKAKHILVRHQYEAEDVLRWLKDGKSFEDLAKKYSTCTSSKSGGDLGDLSGKMRALDENFAEALQSLQLGEISKPVRTQFGYHIILRY